MTRLAITILAALGALAACAPAVPESGVGFSDYTEYQSARAAREAALASPTITGPILPPAAQVTSAPLGATPAAPVSALDAARAALEEPAATASDPGAPRLEASPSNPPPVILNNPGISDEQDFNAVSERRGIQSDAERRAQAQAQYQVVAPQPLPQRQGTGGMTIVEYALATSHPVGQKLYQRFGFNTAERAARACAGYPSPDRAQADFLAQGGPERDRLGLDPDGDGYACGWNPAPFRAAVRG